MKLTLTTARGCIFQAEKTVIAMILKGEDGSHLGVFNQISGWLANKIIFLGVVIDSHVTVTDCEEN